MILVSLDISIWEQNKRKKCQLLQTGISIKLAYMGYSYNLKYL